MAISQILFYGGIVGTAVVVLLSGGTGLLLFRRKQKLDRQLDDEYGPPEK